jgi:hypothetical protein
MCNVGKTDKIIRSIIGIAAVVAGYHYHSWWGLLGLVVLLTAVFSFCPLYWLFGIKTCHCKTDGSNTTDEKKCCH